MSGVVQPVCIFPCTSDAIAEMSCCLERTTCLIAAAVLPVIGIGAFAWVEPEVDPNSCQELLPTLLSFPEVPEVPLLVIIVGPVKAVTSGAVSPSFNQLPQYKTEDDLADILAVLTAFDIETEEAAALTF